MIINIEKFYNKGFKEFDISVGECDELVVIGIDGYRNEYCIKSTYNDEGDENGIEIEIHKVCKKMIKKENE